MMKKNSTSFKLILAIVSALTIIACKESIDTLNISNDNVVSDISNDNVVSENDIIQPDHVLNP